MVNHKDRAHALLSASSASRWLACPRSAMAAELYEDTSTEYADEGTRAHECCQLFAEGKRDEATPDNPEMERCAEEYTAYISELMTDKSSVRFLETRVDYSEYVPEGFGTADCIIVNPGRLEVVDFKYGKGVIVSAVENPQMKLYALGAFLFLNSLKELGVEYDISEVVLHIFQPRIDNISTYELPLAELLKWGESIKKTAKQAYEGKGKYNPGTHCRFCPHAGKCRALAKECTEVAEYADRKVKVETLAPFEIAELLKKEAVITMFLKAIKSEALATLSRGDEIPGFKLVEGKLGNRKWADEARVMEILKDNGYGEEDFTETKLLSPSGMDASLGKKTVAELLGSIITRAPGTPIIVEESDKRPAYEPTYNEIFE